ncbi:hypothetical protein LSAT2_010366, partial [Lamellibrachia satsuma]
MAKTRPRSTAETCPRLTAETHPGSPATRLALPTTRLPVLVSTARMSLSSRTTRLDEVTDVVSVVSGFPLTAAGQCKYRGCINIM